MTAKHMIFKGRVQGVGFRYTVRQIASQYNLTGTVRNLYDGSVEAVFQGSPEDIEGCIDDIKAQFRSFIRDIESTEQIVNPHLNDFRIAF